MYSMHVTIAGIDFVCFYNAELDCITDPVGIDNCDHLLLLHHHLAYLPMHNLN